MCVKILKEQLTENDIQGLVTDLLAYIHDMRQRKEVNLEAAHNIALLLIDLDQYKSKFEKVLLETSSQYYRDLSNSKLLRFVRSLFYESVLE